MKKYRLAAWFALVAMVLNVSVTSAQTLFRNIVKDKHDLKIVSCFTCHARVPAGTDNPKQYRNEFGKLFEDELAGKNVTPRLNAVAELASGDPTKEAVEAAVAKEFNEALEKIEAMPNPGGGTYEDAIKSGQIDGITIKD